jgi:Ribonuclease G/E
MSQRRLFIDDGPLERRGVVTLDGRPERLIIERAGDDPRQALGARVIGRVTSISRALGSAFVDLDVAPAALMEVRPETPRLTEGQAVLVEVRSEARGGKGALARFLELAEGPPRLVEPGPDLAAQLCAADRQAQIVEGEAAREAADIAEAEATQTEFALPGGGRIFVEPTRALTAVDVDLGGGAAAPSKGVARATNLAALGEAARVLRLKGLGGLVVIDLIGRGHDGPAIAAAARTAFAADNPGVSIGPITRFGTLELTVPRRRAPVLERLLDPSGESAAASAAAQLLRALERAAQADRGARLTAIAAPDVAEAARAGLQGLSARYGARFDIAADAALRRAAFRVASR